MDILKKKPRIVITRDEASRKPTVEVEGLWTGRDRVMINTRLRKEMRRKAHEYIKARKQADLLLKKEEVLISNEEKPKKEIEKTSELIQEATIKNNKKEEKEKCPKAKTKKKKLLMKNRKR